ncbi:MAG: hypothetical protein HQK89_11055 [Nitrospirae bacterium]|nr:hypothetical protein [Nitrospirota bacterium]
MKHPDGNPSKLPSKVPLKCMLKIMLRLILPERIGLPVTLASRYIFWTLAGSLLLQVPIVVPMLLAADNIPVCWHLTPGGGASGVGNGASGVGDGGNVNDRDKLRTLSDNASPESDYSHTVDIQFNVNQVGGNVYSFNGQANSFIGLDLNRREISYPITGTGIIGGTFNVDISLAGTAIDGKTGSLVETKIHIAISGLSKTYTQVIRNYGDNRESVVNGKADYCD